MSVPDRKFPSVSVVTVSRNASKTIEKTIRSVASQKFASLEYVVFDGLSTDGTVDILRKHASDIDHLTVESDTGVYNAFNKAVAVSRGEWLLFLGADDVLLPEASTLFEQLEDAADCDLVFTDVMYDDNRRFRSRFDASLMLSNRLHHQGALYRRRCFDDFRYDESLRICADYELNLKLYLEGKRAKKGGFPISSCEWGGLTHSNRTRAKEEVNRVRKKLLPTLNGPLKAMATVLWFAKDFREKLKSRPA